MNTYVRILRYVRPHAGLFGLAIGTMALWAALDAFSYTLLIPFLRVLFGQGDALSGLDTFLSPDAGPVVRFLRGAVGWAIAGRDPMDALRNVVLFLFVIYAVKNVAYYVSQVAISVVEGRVTRDMRNDIYSHLLRLGFPFFQRTRAGQIISRVTNDVEQMRSLVTSNLAKLLWESFQAVFALVIMIGLSWKLTVVAALFMPPMLGLWARLRKRLRRAVLRVLDAVGETASHIQETVSGVRLVKASGAEAWEEARFQKLTRGQYKAHVKNERWRKFFTPATEMITAVSILAMLWYGSWLVLREGSMIPEAFIGFLLFAGKLMSPVKFLAQFPATVQPGLAAAERAFELLDAPVEVFDQPGALPVEGFREAVRFEKVGFAYAPGTPVLEDIEMTIRPGEVVALVGPSGAGKSTMADLLPRFYDPTAGRITLDGRDLRTLKLKDVRALLGIVTQETILFHDTVRNNIAYGRNDASQAEVEAAARAANAHEFIGRLPEGYNTVLGEKGTRLSGGQRQRIAIARALLRNPPILILDEATSALDTESERLVQQAIEQLMDERTVLVIAHRLSTVRRADQILVLDAGRIVERGTHDELLAHGGLYRRLYDMQFGAETDAVEAGSPHPLA
ncbi:ABC transporter ATP-binding protein [Longimicrobium sp.]|uniref:ABC transporter ATP-binding protein n=1 Tax=Longimicrobium sp. TaxID=2029185 RepID=UPI002E2F586A|nr:ABC transporter ATP-binding protein [Longimicrobium sp.]HEX6042557.1 ABC transporter ATP-binding protein [Longimicrobium sp.]